MIVASFVSACEEHSYFERDYPRVRTEQVEFSDTTEILLGEIIFIGDLEVIDHGFVWSTSPNFAVDDQFEISLGVKSEKGNFQYAALTEFIPTKVYYVRAYAKSELYTVHGAEVEFVAK